LLRIALCLATPLELHQYGRRLLAEKKDKEALEIFLLIKPGT
jgi:hypothetical protein